MVKRNQSKALACVATIAIAGVVACSAPSSEPESATPPPGAPSAAEVATQDEAAIAAVESTFATENASPDVRSTTPIPTTDTMSGADDTPMSESARSTLGTLGGISLQSAAPGWTCKSHFGEAPPTGGTGLARLGVAKVSLNAQACHGPSHAWVVSASLIAYNATNHELFTFRQEEGQDGNRKVFHDTKIAYAGSATDQYYVSVKDVTNKKNPLVTVTNPAAYRARNAAVLAASKNELHARGIRLLKVSSSGCAAGVGGVFLGGLGIATCTGGEIFSAGALTPAAAWCFGAAGTAVLAGGAGIASQCFGAPF